MALKILLDSSYILPAFGIALKNISKEDLLKLEQFRVEGIAQYYYSPIVWIEIVPKVLREYSIKRLAIDIRMFEQVVIALENSAQRIDPGPIALRIATKLRILGHRDIIDNMLYGIAIENNLLFLTIDKEFKEFLQSHGLDTSMIIDHKQLFNKLTKR